MYHHLTYEKRHTLAILLQEKYSYSKIAELLQVSVSTISREIKRNKNRRRYNAKDAQKKAEKRYKPHNKKIKLTLLRQALKLLTTKQWSPLQISGYFARFGISISHETIYKVIRADKQNGGILYKHCRHRLKYRKRHVGKLTHIPDRMPIAMRPIEANGTRFGDWEMDTIVGKNNKGAIVTLVERSTDFCLIRKLHKGKNATELAKTVTKLLKPYKNHVLTITTDNGVEFAKHKIISKRLKTDVYFTDPYSSWQKGNIENTNKLIRQYIPKQTDIEDLDNMRLKRIEDKINSRPRAKLHFFSPKFVFSKNL